MCLLFQALVAFGWTPVCWLQSVGYENQQFGYSSILSCVVVEHSRGCSPSILSPLLHRSNKLLTTLSLPVVLVPCRKCSSYTTERCVYFLPCSPPTNCCYQHLDGRTENAVKTRYDRGRMRECEEGLLYLPTLRSTGSLCTDGLTQFFMILVRAVCDRRSWPVGQPCAMTDDLTPVVTALSRRRTRGSNPCSTYTRGFCRFPSAPTVNDADPGGKLWSES